MLIMFFYGYEGFTIVAGAKQTERKRNYELRSFRMEI